MKVGRIVGSIVVSLSLACAARATPEVDAQVANLTSEDAKVAEVARRNLEAMGAEVVPMLFDKLLVADWNLRPRLLEVLSKHGREFAKQKLLKGNETEKIYAALAYELTRARRPDDYGTPEFKAMVEALLKGIKSEDKRLRAVAGSALVHDTESPVFFKHFHDIVPSMISSFDTELVIGQRARGDPSEVLLVGMCLRLDALIGDRLGYLDIERGMWAGTSLAPDVDRGNLQHSMEQFVNKNRQPLGELREYWERWWEQHRRLTPTAIGQLAIERDIALLESPATERKYDTVVLFSFLKTWSGELFADPAAARAWWNSHKGRYTGPPEPDE